MPFQEFVLLLPPEEIRCNDCLVTTEKKWRMGIALIIGSVGIASEVLVALILFRSYRFFEAVVVCLLVMILCAVSAMRADFEPGGYLHRRDVTPKEDEPQASSPYFDGLAHLRWRLKAMFQAIAFTMALVKLVIVLLANA